MKRITCLILFLFAFAANPLYGDTSESLSSVMKEYREASQLTNPDSANARLGELVKRLEKTDAQAGNDKASSKESVEIQYLALVKMALNEIQKASSSNESSSKKFREDALSHLYRAAILDPNRPEALICLAWLRQERGEDPGWYINKARYISKNVPNVDLILLEGRMAEMTGNYSLAALTYAKALQPNCKYLAEPFFLTKFRTSVQMAQGEDASFGRMAKFYWVPDVYEKLNYGDSADAGKKEMSQLRNAVRKAVGKSHICTYVQDDHVYRFLLNQNMLRALRTYPNIRGYDGGYRFSKLMDSKVPTDQVETSDAKPRKLAAAFLAASLDMDPAKLKELESQWDRIEAEAKKFVDSETDPKNKAKKLFGWLKDNVLQEYDIAKGSTGGQVVQSKKYFMCMTGAITYTLLAQSVGLDSKGVFKPGHALAAVDCSDGRCFVETTVPKEKVNEGFKEISKSKVDEKTIEQSREARKRGGVYFSSKEEIVAAPKLVAMQYANLRIKIDVTLLEKHRDKVKEIIKTMAKKHKASKRDTEAEVMKITLLEFRERKNDQTIKNLSDEFINDLVDNIWPKMAHQEYRELFVWVADTLTSKYPECMEEYRGMVKKVHKMELLGLRLDPSIANDVIDRRLADYSKEVRKAQHDMGSVAERIKSLPFSEARKVAVEKMEEKHNELSARVREQQDDTVAEVSELMANLRKLDHDKGRTIPNSPFRTVYGRVLKLAFFTDNATVANNIISEIIAGAEIKPEKEQERPL